jgi:hypothetical protein
MAAIENLEIVVSVDISDALADLKNLKEELEDVAREIRSLRREGRRGFTVQSDVESIDDDLTIISSKIEAWEAANSIDIDTNVSNINLPSGGGGMGGGGGGGGGGGLLAALSGIRSDDGMFETMRNARRSFGQLAENSEITNINMADMHNILARLIPLLLVFIGAIPAAVTAIYTLAAAAAVAAAAMAAMAGFGALGFAMEDGQFQMENLTEAFNQVREDFLDAFAPLANRLQPLFEDALEGLERFFDAVAAEGDALMALTDEARAFGGFLIDFIPDALRTLAAMVEGLSGIFARIGQVLERNFANIVRTMVRLTAEAAPLLGDFVMTLGMALPAIIEMSMGFLRLATVVIQALAGFGRFLSLLGISPRAFGLVTAALLTLISTFALGSSIVGSVFVSSLWSAITGLFQFMVSSYAASGALTVFGGTAISSAVASLIGFTASLFTSAAALLGFELSAYQAAIAAATFWTAVTVGLAIGLVAFVTSMAASFTSLAGSIGDATTAMKDFNSVQSGMSGSGFGAGGADNPYGFDPDNPDDTPGGGGGVTVFNVESSGDPDEDRSNMEHADWMSGRTTGGS